MLPDVPNLIERHASTRRITSLGYNCVMPSANEWNLYDDDDRQNNPITRSER